ncbi:MAG: hypothetical protein K8J08_07930 [Thermoanaerobaculia bacterium]|nr:hypothetical protein [Thermoanaerobaculia bacterium]
MKTAPVKVPETSHLEEVRDELRRMGYLTHGVERYLLQDALRPVEWRRTVLRLALKLGLLGGASMSLVSALLLAHWNESLRRDPFDLIPLFFHLLPLWFLLFGGFFLILAGAMALALKRFPGLRLSMLSLYLAVAGLGLGLAAGAWWMRGEIVHSAGWPGALVALGAAVAAYAVARLLYHGLLALAIRLTDRTPRERAERLQWTFVGVALAAALASLVSASLLAGGEARVADVLPSGPAGRVLVVGIDGLLGPEFDYLLARGDLPVVGGLLETGGVSLTYARPDVDPAALWTTVATGLPSPLHGVAAVDSFRPRGLHTALTVNGPFRSYWDSIERPLGLSEHRPVLANRRSALTFWEFAARGGAPIVAVDWWSTFPAQDLSGTVVAHGAYQLLAEGVAGSVAPASELERLRGLLDPDRVTREDSVTREDERSLEIARSALGAAADSVVERALRPETFYREAFLLEIRPETRAAALYLPALDLVASDWAGGEVAFVDLVRSEVTAADRTLGQALEVGEWDTVVLIADPGRRSEGTANPQTGRSSDPRSGRIILWNRRGCDAARGDAVALEQVAAGLFRALGLPQSAELPDPPQACRWPIAPVTIDTFGRREVELAIPKEGDEYLDNLRSLGYL